MTKSTSTISDEPQNQIPGEPLSPENGERPQQEWDRIIGPCRKWFDVSLSELIQYRYLLTLFIRRDFVAFYKQTLLGPLWFLIQPVLMSLMYVLVFSRIAGLSTDNVPPIVFYLAGVTTWNYFAECFMKTAETFHANAAIFGKVYFPRLIVPLSIVVSNLARFGIQFVLFLAVVGWYVQQGKVQPQWTALFLPYLLVLMATIGLGAGLIFSALTSKYRDLRFLIQFGVQLLMYSTPIIYPLSSVPSNAQRIIAWNPLTPIFECFRHGFVGEGIVSPSGLLFSSCFAFAVLVIGILVFNQTENSFIDTV